MRRPVLLLAASFSFCAYAISPKLAAGQTGSALLAQDPLVGGGNDGSVFQRYGSVDIPLGWPLRSHSPGEVIDTRDLDALAKIIAVLAKGW